MTSEAALNGGSSPRTNPAAISPTAAAGSSSGARGGNSNSNGGGTMATATNLASTMREQTTHNGGERFRDIPELIETGPSIGQCITMRTDALGKPPLPLRPPSNVSPYFSPRIVPSTGTAGLGTRYQEQSKWQEYQRGTRPPPLKGTLFFPL